MRKNASKPVIIDCHQNFWQLASIQGAALGLPVILVGSEIAAQYGMGSAIVSVVIGNLILWLISLAIVSMSVQDRKDAIENVKENFGYSVSIVVSLILIIAFIDWYILQIKSTTLALKDLHFFSNIWTGSLAIRLGAFLGMIVALVSLGGIKLIKWFSTISLPFLIAYGLYLAIKSEKEIAFQNIQFSFSSIISVVAIILPGIINLPTFFRHSRSKADSFLALTLMQLIVIFFQILSIFIGTNSEGELVSQDIVGRELFFYVLFVLVSTISVNLVNIYFASAGWEKIFPHKWVAREYAIVGLIGTACYTFLQVLSPMQFIINMSDYFIASLGTVLLCDFLVRIVVRHRPRTYEKLISISCWIVGCITAYILQEYFTLDSSQIMIFSMTASALSFIFVIFMEETLWSSKKLFLRRRK